MKKKEVLCPKHKIPFLPEGKGLWQVAHFGCDYPSGGCDCYCGVYCKKVYLKNKKV